MIISLQVLAITTLIIALLPAASAINSTRSPCETDIGQSCQLLPCPLASQGSCVDGSCKCGSDQCAVRGVCQMVDCVDVSYAAAACTQCDEGSCVTESMCKSMCCGTCKLLTASPISNSTLLGPSLRGSAGIASTKDGMFALADGAHPVINASTSNTSRHASTADENSQKKMDCLHGIFEPGSKSCHCFDGWGTAGVTDTVNFLQGVCEQYHCQSDTVCRQHLGIADAKCPVTGWNCYCGWGYAISGWGEGYETPTGEFGGGKCMGVMYTFSFWVTYSCVAFMLNAWRVISVLAIIMLPFGRKRANCDHHRPSIWTWMRRLFMCPSSCRGECVMSPRYTSDLLKDDLAWSIYVLDVGIWLYMFTVALWFAAVSLWSILVIVIVVLVLVCALIVGALALCGEAIGSCDTCDAALCYGTQCDASCCACCYMGGGVGDAPMDAMLFYGPYPTDPFLFSSPYAGSSPDCCNCCCVSIVCRPIALLFYVFPTLPENAWGGFVGYFFLGTHQLTPPQYMYTGGNRIVEFFGMAWRRPNDLHGDDSWRLQVYNFLTQEGQQVPQVALDHLDHDNGMRSAASGDEAVLQPFLQSQEGGERRVLGIGLARAVCIDRAFNSEEDQCVPSSFEDYQKNSCWICTADNDEWDLWISCRHLFCKGCSEQMLRRRMPCPLCRVSSSVVVRGKSWEPSSSTAMTDQNQVFQAASSFQGRRAGMVFKLGDRGLGYYSDDAQMVAEAREKATEDATVNATQDARRSATDGARRKATQESRDKEIKQAYFKATLESRDRAAKRARIEFAENARIQAAEKVRHKVVAEEEERRKAAEAKAAEANAAAAAEAQAAEVKAVEAKEAEPNAAVVAEAKAADVKAAETKEVEAKAAEAKAAEDMEVEVNAAEGNAADAKAAQLPVEDSAKMSTNFPGSSRESETLPRFASFASMPSVGSWLMLLPYHEAPTSSEGSYDISSPPVASSVTLPVQFRIKCEATKPDQTVFIVGSVPELGEWNPKKAIQCITTESNFPMWISPNINFTTPGQHVEFKMVLQNEQLEHPSWEGNANRILELPADDVHKLTIVTCAWGENEVTHHRTTDEAVVAEVASEMIPAMEDVSAAVSPLKADHEGQLKDAQEEKTVGEEQARTKPTQEEGKKEDDDELDFNLYSDEDMPTKVEYTGKNGFTISFAIEGEHLIRYVNGMKLVGNSDFSGVVTSLSYKTGQPHDVRDQHGVGSDDVPDDVVTKLKVMADSCSVQNNLPLTTQA